ncbi:chitobiase/beta-hexosaminidase C-terminal domain-containing protein [Paenibacillus sp. BC26]|uniref:chitobiase/beta-hexosaminidase C-terminal domain-containing protein n=1 Tax=Paenibacillus sp. BC26 TaxID=1881032 RepID=UPI0008F31996|nr:chitobiase/beta-hexosaminidase C-terminal domain-containing protein [Paenibacillus sp. BC26]SFS54707.1 Beta-galactosidase [Paenibacillus sp. BC26]
MRKNASLLLLYGLLGCLIPLSATGDAAPLSYYEIEIDHLRDWKQVYKHSDTLFLTKAPGETSDPTRVKRSGVSGENMVYKAEGYLRSFAVYAYYQPNGSKTYDHPAFYISKDGVTYIKVIPDRHEVDSGAVNIVYESRKFPAGTKFLKVVYQGSSIARSPAIGKVVLNGPSSADTSVPSGTVPYGRMVMLNQGEKGETIYYTTDGSDPRTSLTRMHYSSPIAVVQNLLLQITAVGHSSTGQSAATGVSTYRYVPAPQLAPPVGLIDPLDNFKLLANRANLYVASNQPGYFDNDKGRLARTTSAPGSMVYHTGYDIQSFTVYSSFFTGNPLEEHRLFVSSDGKDYKQIPVTINPVGYPTGNWQQYAYEASGLPEHSRYLKIVLLGSKAWSPQVSKVVINQNTASVKLATSRSESSVKTELTSITKGARIYYRLNKGPDFVYYSKPLQLQGYNVLETYAVKDGWLPSPIRKFTVNASSEILVDRFGQMKTANFTGKVTDEKELAADAAADAAYYGSLKPPGGRDPYGGLAGSAKKYNLAAKGYFAIQRMGERKVMTTPDGNLYFSLAVNGVTANETYTRIAGREQKFESVLPNQGVNKNAYIGKDNYSFYVANVFRKKGVFPTEHAIYSEAVTRLPKWGFNGVGNYSPEKYGEDGKLPYVRMLPLNGMAWARINGLSLFDIFAPNAAEQIDKAFKNALTPNKNDKNLIGYFIDNEYDFHKFYTNVPKLKASSAAMKGKLVQRLKDKYQTISSFNANWKTTFKSFDEMKEAELPVSTSQSWRDMEAFFDYYLDTFFGTVSRAYRKYDPNHLLLGDRWITTTFHNEKISSALAKAEGKYVDVISINYYTYKLEPDLLKKIYDLSGNKPILFSEFGYGTSEQGLAPLLPNSAVNQFQRGMRYRNYVEGAVTLPYVVGAHVFNYVDQAGLGRYWQGEGGEHYNSGLVNVADRPYKDYLKAIMDTNYDIYKVMLGERAKFYYDFNKG